MKTESPKSGPTAAQRAWVESLGSLGATKTEATADDAGPRGTRGAKGAALADAAPGEVFGLFDPSDIPGLLLKTLDPHSSTVRVNNNTDFTLRLDPASINEVDDEAKIGLSHGKFDSLPPDPIDPRKGGEFKASSNVDPIFKKTLTGVEGRVRYFIDDQGTTWTFHHNNPFAGSNKADDSRVDGPNKAKFATPKPAAGGGDNGVFLFTLDQVGGGGGGTQPPPGPTPTDLKASCLVTVTNDTKHVLRLVEQGHERGDFMTFPPKTVQPGTSVTFASVETPGAKEQGCKGFVAWEVGTPSAVAFWKVGWDNPEQAQNTTSVTLEPPNSFQSLEQIGQGEDNVPVAFTLSGGGGPVTPPPPPGPQEEFIPPVEARQPTLRKGDKSVDGWVEYLQTLLNHHMQVGLTVDGDFGAATEKAVVAFQTQKKLQVDRVVGNQTWAALREGAPEKPSTDGRKPHSHVEGGVEARWDRENQDAVYVTSADEMQMFVTSVGEARIDDRTATVRITPPGTQPSVVKVKIGAPTKVLPTGAGHAHVVKLVDFKKRFPATDPNARIVDYKLEAFLEQDLGGDLWTGGKIVER